MFRPSAQAATSTCTTSRCPGCCTRG
jgi:hypothetical protein